MISSQIFVVGKEIMRPHFGGKRASFGRTTGGGGGARAVDLIPRSGPLAASRRMRRRLRWPHGSPGDAKHRPETREDALLTMRVWQANTKSHPS
jgi:hypothetical protein